MDRKEISKQLREYIAEADMVLVGIGEEFECQEYLQKCQGYPELCEKIAAAGAQWMMPYVNAYFLRDNLVVRKALEKLRGFLEEKNVFVVSVAMNGLLAESGLKADRVVEPCGDFSKVQCGKGCRGTVRITEKEILNEVELVCKGEKNPEEVHAPCMEDCGHSMEFNSLYAEHYLEEGYQEGWNRYTKWLQGTLNKKLCVLELGSGMMFASILRFRFEKIVGLNQKAKLVRIHRNLYQLPEEIAEKSMGISQNAVDFMAEMPDL